MNPARWERFCVVGLGGHALSKLIPAIRANGQQLAGVVTRKAPAPELEARSFPLVTHAIAALPPDTVFMIASPPAAHFQQAQAALSAGRDVVIEKPAFVTEREAEAACIAAQKAGSLLVEGYINRHTLTHRHFLDSLTRQRPAKLDFAFTIPAVPSDTFRAEADLASSNLYDIASSFLATLLDADLPAENLELTRVDRAGEPAFERLHFAGLLAGIEANALTGVDAEYRNRMRATWSDGSSIEYQPFIYGRAGQREVTRTTPDGAVEHDLLHENDAFAAMFSVSRSEWRATAERRLLLMRRTAANLERLGRSLAASRNTHSS